MITTRRRKNGKRFNYPGQDPRVNIIIRSHLITSFIVLFIYISIIYTEKLMVLPAWLTEIQVVIGGIIVAWVLWSVVNYLVSKHILSK